MAQKVQVILIDDVDGSVAEESVQFALDGRNYEIDLNGKNAEALRKALQPWVRAGRRTGGRSTRGLTPVNRNPRTAAPNGAGKLSKEDRAALAEFARKNGHKPVADRGRVSEKLIADWRAAGEPR